MRVILLSHCPLKPRRGWRGPDVHFLEPEINTLLKALQNSTRHARRTYFRQILACRRRVQKQWDNAPITRVFRLGNEFRRGCPQRAWGRSLTSITMHTEVEPSQKEMSLAGAAANLIYHLFLQCTHKHVVPWSTKTTRQQQPLPQ